ncbi:MAG: T9SS type A sorting domain-containing protein [Candidatus Cloacimonas sp.]
MRKLMIIIILTACFAFTIDNLIADEVVIGTGNQQERIPLDFFYKNSLYECLYYQDELGFAQGSISNIAFYNNFVSNIANKPTKIWLGTSNLTDLNAGWIPSTNLTLVFDGTVNYPSGIHTIDIELDSLFQYTGGNLVMMVFRPLDTSYYSSSDKFYCQTDNISRARRAYHDTQIFDPANPPTTGSVINGQFPKVKFTYTSQSILTDLACPAIFSEGVVTLGAQEEVDVQINNYGYEAQDNYTINLRTEEGELLASAAGNPVAGSQVITQTLTWIPTTPGSYRIFGEILLTGDEDVSNNLSPSVSVTAFEEGYLNFVIGIGNMEGYLPLDFTWPTSLFETIIYAPEMESEGIITHLKFYNNFVENITNKPVIIWLGETDLVNLPLSWIPSTQLTMVYYGNMSFPSGQNEIVFPLSPTYHYQGRNLVLMVQRPFDSQSFNTNDKFKMQPGAMQRTKYIYSEQEEHDPASPPLYAFDTNQYPQTGFVMRPNDTGFLRGTVRNGTNLVGGAIITADNNHIAYTSEEGTYSLLLNSGVHNVSVTANGLHTVNRQVNVISGSITIENFNLDGSPVQDDQTPALTTCLKGVFPNPFNPETTISFAVGKNNTPVTIELFDLKGRKVNTLIDTIFDKGEHQLHFSAVDNSGGELASGIYFIRLSATDYRKTIKAMLLK